jgi:broad specificity phosphatase PhoE
VTETTILLVRHGETDWNQQRRVQGHSDTPLNETGIAQARALIERLADEPVEAVYSSDLARALDTARGVAEERGLPVHQVRELREKDFGTWEGLTDTEIFERFPQAHDGPWGDAETGEQLAERVLGALRRIGAEHPGGTVVVVTHGGPLRAVLRHCEVEAVGRIANCHVAKIAIRDGNLRSVD